MAQFDVSGLKLHDGGGRRRLRNVTWHGYTGDIETDELPEISAKDLLRDDPSIEHPASKALPPDVNSIHPDDYMNYRFNTVRYEDA